MTCGLAVRYPKPRLSVSSRKTGGRQAKCRIHASATACLRAIPAYRKSISDRLLRIKLRDLSALRLLLHSYRSRCSPPLFLSPPTIPPAGAFRYPWDSPLYVRLPILGIELVRLCIFVTPATARFAHVSVPSVTLRLRFVIRVTSLGFVNTYVISHTRLPLHKE